MFCLDNGFLHMRRREGALDNGSALSRFAQIRSRNQTRVGLVSSPGSPGFFTWEKPAGNLCGMKMPKNTFAPAVQQCEIFFSPRMIACEGLTELTQCPLEGRLSVVCGRYELSLRICTGRGFTVTIVIPAAWRFAQLLSEELPACDLIGFMFVVVLVS